MSKQKEWTVDQVIFTFVPLAFLAGFLVCCLFAWESARHVLVNLGYTYDGEKKYVILDEEEFDDINKQKIDYRELQWLRKQVRDMKIIIQDLDKQNIIIHQEDQF